MDVERYADRLISEALERGELDPQEGVGEPLGELSNDPDWWVRAFLEREALPDRHAEIVDSVATRLSTAVATPSLDEARTLLGEVNDDVRRWNGEAPSAYHLEERSEIWLVSERAKRPASGPGASSRV